MEPDNTNNTGGMNDVPSNNAPAKRKLSTPKILAIIAILVVAGIAAFFIWNAVAGSSDDTSSTPPASDQAASSDSTENKESADDTVSESTDPKEDPNLTYTNIDDWGVKIPVDNSVAGLKFTISNNKTGGGTTGIFNTNKVACSEGAVNVARGTKTDHVPTETGVGDTYDVYYTQNKSTLPVAVHIGEYYYVTPGYHGAACTTDGKVSEGYDEGVKALEASLNKMVAK